MPDDLTVHINREGLHTLSVPDSFAASDGFDVVLVNHGGSTHVHLHLDDALSKQAALDAPNHHVEGGRGRRVRVTRTGDGTARGNLKVVTGYGATTRLVDVELTEPVATDEPVEVGEELTKPQPRTEEASTDGIRSVPLGPMLAAGGVGVGLAVGGAAVFGSVVAVLAVVGLTVGVVVLLAVQRYRNR